MNRVAALKPLQGPWLSIEDLERNLPAYVPEAVAKCPICDSLLVLTAIPGATEQASGKWIPDEIDIECIDEPDIEDPEWEEWNRGHYNTPYIDWLPIDLRIQGWLGMQIAKERQ